VSTEDARLELAVFSARGVQTYPLAAGKALVVGRGEDADIRIDEAAVSRRHAVFHSGPPLEVEDLGSANGTFVSPARALTPGAASEQTADQKRVSVKGARLALGIGDSIFFGPSVVVVRSVRVEEPKSAGATSASNIEVAGAIVRDPALRRVYDEAARAASMSIPVLIVGETGAGKDVLARFIHEKSPRAKKPFVALNCAAITETLAESQLFGHEKGAFTGAQHARAGVFEAASGGTVFLDEIGELPLATQAKLLRTLESAEVQRVGSMKTIKVDVRFVSATNRDLERASKQGAFRQDLYFRVNGITLRVPPLRERKSEIADLARRFLDAASRSVGRSAPEISSEAMRALESYAWPGNVRELRWMMERMLVTAVDGPILLEHLPEQVLAADGGGDSATGTEAATKERVIEALEKCDGNQTRAAEMLGISRRTLINRMIEFDLPRPRKG
jgi:DNA-binding NtrC family response regulator